MLELGKPVTWTPRPCGKQKRPITGTVIGIVEPQQNTRMELLRLRAGQITRRSQIKFEVSRVTYTRALVEVWVGSTPFYYAPSARAVREVAQTA